jgi:hypothetical protein
MRLIKYCALFFILLLAVNASGIDLAQVSSIQVSLPIHGNFVFIGTPAGDKSGVDKLFLVDTFTGEWRLVAENQKGIGNPVWDFPEICLLTTAAAAIAQYGI